MYIYIPLYSVRSKIFAALNFCKSSKIGFLHFIFHEIQADDQKITLNMNTHDYIYAARKFLRKISATKISDYMVVWALSG